MNIKELKEMVSLMEEHGLSELELEKEGLKIKLKKGGRGEVIQSIQPAVGAMPPLQVVPSAGVPAGAGAAQAENAHLIRSPMVGSFYLAPAPDADPFVTKGREIKENDVICIIEAMKLMNEIKSDVSGTVLEILVENGQAVEFDQPLFKIQLS